MTAEFGGFLLDQLAAGHRRGDGHGVLLLPGWLTDDAATAPLRHALRRLGYAAHGWGLGRNLGPTADVHAGLPRRLRALHAATGGPVSLVGVSLGGVLARRLAGEHPELVRRVVTLSSPFRLYEDGRAPGPVPTTSVFTRGDGIVPWQACVEGWPGADDVEVRGSHCGLGHNRLALRVVTDRLGERVEEPRWNR